MPASSLRYHRVHTIAKKREISPDRKDKNLRSRAKPPTNPYGLLSPYELACPSKPPSIEKRVELRSVWAWKSRFKRGIDLRVLERRG